MKYGNPGAIFGGYGKSSVFGVSNVGAAGITSVASPAPPSPYTNWLQFDTAQVHGTTLRQLGSASPASGAADSTWVDQYLIRRDAGTISQACFLMRRDTTNSTRYALKWNTSGNLDFYYDDALLVTLTVASNTTTSVIIFVPGSPTAGTQVKVTVIQDGTTILNVYRTLTNAPIVDNASPTYGETAAAGSNTLKWYMLRPYAGYTDRADPVGKVTAKDWALTLAGSPVWDQSTKSTGTDAAALVDERPPAGSGTTDSDYYKLIPNTTGIYQSVPLSDTLLSAGDTLLALNIMSWDRAAASGKNLTPRVVLLETAATALINDIDGITAADTSITYDTGGGQRPVNYGHILIDSEEMAVSADSGTVLTVTRGQNGTTAATHADNATIRWFKGLTLTTLSGITSYADHRSSDGVNTIDLAPDNTQWSGKANAYLNTIEVGVAPLRSSDGTSDLRVDDILVEAAIVLSGDSISALADPPSARRVFVC